MNRLAYLSFVSLALAPPAMAEPLTFGAINGADDFSGQTEIASCEPKSLWGGGRQTCALARTSFGGLPIETGTVTLNGAGRVQAVRIALDGGDYELAYRFLVGRYGRPSSAGEAPSWSGFDDGAAITIGRSAARALIAFEFPANAEAADMEPDGARIWSLLLFALGGVAAGLIIRRVRNRDRRRWDRPRRTGVDTQPSMRATLERRLRENRDFQF